jgi:hypothetical protein
VELGRLSLLGFAIQPIDEPGLQCTTNGYFEPIALVVITSASTISQEGRQPL